MTVPWEAITVVGLLAVGFTGLSAYRLGRERWLRRGGVKTRALVVGQSETAGNDGDSARSPILEFTTADGRTIRTSSPVSSDLPTALPGRVMTVYYNPNKPDEVAIVGYGRGVLRVFLLIGILLFGVLAAMVFVPAGILLGAMPIFVPVVMCCAFLGIGGYGIGRVWVIRARGGRAQGVVVGETTTRTREGMPLHHPVVRFRLPNGHELEATSERGRTVRRVRQGQAVQVRYHRNDPYRMVLAGDGARPLFYVFALAGLLLLGGTATVLRLVFLL